MVHDEHCFTRVKWRVAVPSVQGKWSVEGKGVEDKTENPSIGGKFKILLRLLASAPCCRSQDRQRLAEAPTTINWRARVRECVSMSDFQMVRVGSRWITMVEWRVIQNMTCKTRAKIRKCITVGQRRRHVQRLEITCKNLVHIST